MPFEPPLSDRELTERLGRVDASARVVPVRALRRVVRRLRGVSWFDPHTPHSEHLDVPAAALRRAAADVDLGFDLATTPDPVILLASPEAERFEDAERQLRRLWRRLFHAHVDRELAGRPPQPGELAALAGCLGPAGLGEVRAVLDDEGRLVADGDAVFRELAALLLELHVFESALLSRYFPSIDDLPAALRLLSAGLDVRAIFERTRPPGVADAQVAPPAPSEPAVAPTPEIEALAERLRLALGGGPSPSQWAEALGPVARAASRRFGVERRLLQDLRKTCFDHERQPFRVDLLGFAATLGRRPLRRSLPAETPARKLRHLQRAAAKVPATHVSDGARRALSAAFEQAVAGAEAAVRALVTEAVERAAATAGLVPRNVPERVEVANVAATLCDRVVERGFISYGDVRDAIAHGDLKLPDLALPMGLVRRDALLRLDAALATSLEGLYRPGEVYLRGLQRLSALASATAMGRFVTKYVALPFGGAFVALEGSQHMLNPALERLGRAPIHLASPWSVLGVGVLVLLLIVLPGFRRVAASSAFAAGRALLFVPRAVYRWPALRRVLASRGVRLVGRYALRPAIWGGLALLGPALAGAGPPVWLGVGGATAVAALTFRRYAVRVEDAVSEALGRVWTRLRFQLVPGLIRWVLDLFAQLLKLFERGVYLLDEWLRFRTGQSRVTLAAKALLGPLVRGAAYIVRLYVMLLVEPEVNPVKHFPVVTVAAKLMLPFKPAIFLAMNAVLIPVLGAWLGNAVSGVTVIFLPGLAGFLAWELSGNWRLYEANRPPVLAAVAIGHHGETIARFLRPGIHSGTVPSRFRRWRRALARGHHRAAHRHEHALLEVELAVRRFVERELCALVAQTGRAVALYEVHLSSNRIRLTFGPERVLLSFEEQSGRLIARVSGRRDEPLQLGLAGLCCRAGAADAPPIAWGEWVRAWDDLTDRRTPQSALRC